MHTPSPFAWLTASLLIASLWLLRRLLRLPPASPSAPSPPDALPFLQPPPASPPNTRDALTALDALDTSWSRMRCTSCQRAFSLGTRRCPLDGHHCVREHIFGLPLSTLIIKAKVCPACGVQHPPNARACSTCAHCIGCADPTSPPDPNEAPPITAPAPPTHLVVRVHGKQDLVDIQPVVICPRCHAEQVISPLCRCVRCDTTLTPALLVAGRLSVGYPPEGVGPKTQVCPRCGSRCAPNLSFCARDGARLITLN